MTVPDDLQEALLEDPAAAEFFATLNSRNRYAILYRVQSAKKPETRAKRIEKFVTMLANGERSIRDVPFLASFGPGSPAVLRPSAPPLRGLPWSHGVSCR